MVVCLGVQVCLIEQVTPPAPKAEGLHAAALQQVPGTLDCPES